MQEDLLNAVSNLVHRHVLVTLHAMTGAMLAQLDAGGEVDLGEKAPTPVPTKPALVATSPKPSTLERKQRLLRAKARAATGAAAPVTPAPADPWPALRAELHAAIKARHLSRSKVAADLGVSKGSICGWLLPHGAPPSAGNIARIRDWIDAASPVKTTAPLPPEPEPPPAPAPEDSLAAFRLSAAERDRLRGYISVQSEPELRELFGMTRPLLERAVVSERLDAAVITKLRTVLTGNGAAAE